MKKVLVIAHKHCQHYGLFDDLRTNVKAYLRFTVLRPINNKYLKLLRRIHLSKKIDTIIHLPYKYIWYNYHDVPSLTSELQHIVVIDLSLEDPLLIDVLKKCRRKDSQLRISLFFLNAIGSIGTEKRNDLKNAIENINKFRFDEIYTFDIGDAKKYGMKYLGFNYYSKHKIESISRPQYAIYYIGRSTLDRNDLFYKVYNKLLSEGCSFDFYLKPKKTEENRLTGINYIESRMRSYFNVLEDLQNSMCILEILRDKQCGPSLRYFEAVCYNKKLLTTNSEIVNFPYYDNRYMKVFTNADEIDIEWLKDDSSCVDYHYKGDFSPITLINQLLAEQVEHK